MKKICIVLCLASTTIGIIIGWQVGEKIGIAALPPNAWAGDGVGILVDNIHGASWGMLIGLGVGMVCSTIWYLISRRSKAQSVVLQVGYPDDQVWPPAPTHKS